MKLWYAEGIDEKGELLWRHDIWNQSNMMSAWIWLRSYEQGFSWDD